MDIQLEKKKGIQKKHIPYIAGGVCFLILVGWVVFGNHASTLKVDARGLNIGNVTREQFNDFVRTDSGLKFCHGRIDEGRWRPVSGTSAYFKDEVSQDPAAFSRMEHFRVELYGIRLLSPYMVCRVDDIFRGGYHLTAFRQPDNRVPVGHPHLGLFRHPLEQG